MTALLNKDEDALRLEILERDGDGAVFAAKYNQIENPPSTCQIFLRQDPSSKKPMIHFSEPHYGNADILNTAACGIRLDTGLRTDWSRTAKLRISSRPYNSLPPLVI